MPRVLDSRGRELVEGARVESSLRQSAATVRHPRWWTDDGITVDHDGDHTWSFYKTEPASEPNACRCPDLQLIEEES